MLDRTIAPPFKEIESFKITKAESFKLDNGIPLFLVKAGTEKIVRIEFIFNGGHWYEPYNGVSYFTSKLLSAGTSAMSAKEIEEKIALYGAFLDIISGYDRSALTLYTLPKHLNSLLPTFLNFFQDSIFPDTEFENLKKITKQNYKVNTQKTSFVASQHFRKNLFGNSHPYSSTIDENAVNSINKSDLISYYKEMFSSSNMSIIIAGNADENLFELFNTTLGKIKWGENTNPEFEYAAKSEGNKEVLIEQNESIQSSIRIGSLLPSINHPDYFTLNLLIEILGGYFGSRLMKNIREDKGYTYGINSSFHSLKNAGYLIIGTDVNKENTSNTIIEIFKEIEILKNELVSQEELAIVKNYLAGSFLSSLSTPFGLADRFKTLYYHNLDYNFYDNYLSSLKETNSEDILRVANKYLIEQDLVQVIAGGK